MLLLMLLQSLPVNSNVERRLSQSLLQQVRCLGDFQKKVSMLIFQKEVMGNDFSEVPTVLKSDVKIKGVNNFISWCEEYIENLEKGEKDRSKEGVQPFKCGDVANVVES